MGKEKGQHFVLRRLHNWIRLSSVNVDLSSCQLGRCVQLGEVGSSKGKLP